MAKLPPQNDSSRDTANDKVGTPRWVKVFGIIAIVVILLFVILLVIGGSHGPRRHMRVNSGQRMSFGGQDEIQRS